MCINIFYVALIFYNFMIFAFVRIFSDAFQYFLTCCNTKISKVRLGKGVSYIFRTVLIFFHLLREANTCFKIEKLVFSCDYSKFSFSYIDLTSNFVVVTLSILVSI